jgi:hypothetical protein
MLFCKRSLTTDIVRTLFPITKARDIMKSYISSKLPITYVMWGNQYVRRNKVSMSKTSK